MGKDIKRFADLPLDVQLSIKKLGFKSIAEFKKRTEAAVKYQHLFPDRTR